MERLTDESGFSSSPLLPTPNASVSQDGERPETFFERRLAQKALGRNGNGIGLPLTIAVQLLPTPAGSDGSRGPDYAAATREGTGGDSLTTTVARLNAETEGLLADPNIRLLPTPQESDGFGGRNETAAMRRGGKRPSGAKATLPLPTAIAMRGELTAQPFAAGSLCSDVALPGQLTLEDASNRGSSSGCSASPTGGLTE